MSAEAKRFTAAAIPFHPIQVIPALHQRARHSLLTDDFLGGDLEPDNYLGTFSVYFLVLSSLLRRARGQ